MWNNQKSAISKMSIILHEIFLWFIVVREVMWQKALENIGLDTCKETAIDRIIGPIYGNPICMRSTIISRILPCWNYPIKPILLLWPFALLVQLFLYLTPRRAHQLLYITMISHTYIKTRNINIQILFILWHAFSHFAYILCQTNWIQNVPS